MMMLAGCAPSSKPPIERALPPPPEWLRPVPLPPVQSGTDARLVAAQNRAAAARANRRLNDASAWYGAIVKDYAGTSAQ
jgi:hypothetical protein